jgi:hypothetical protein
MSETISINMHCNYHFKISKDNVERYINFLEEQFNLPKLEYAGEEVIDIFNIMDNDNDRISVLFSGIRSEPLNYRALQALIEAKIEKLNEN